MSRKTRTIVAVVLYLQAAYFTGAYRSNHVQDDNPFREVADVYSGVLWPVYWNSRPMLWVTE